MSVFFGYTPKEKQEVAPALAARKINLVRATPYQINWAVHLDKIQPGYKTYTGFLPAYMQAMLLKTPADMSVFGSSVDFPLSDAFPFTYPSVSVSPITATAEIVEALASLGGQEASIRGERIWTFASPSRECLRQLSSMPLNSTCATSINTVNMSCMKSIRMTVMILACFLKLHKYSGYRDQAHVMSDDPWMFEIGRAESKKRKRPTLKESPKKKKGKLPATADEDEESELTELEEEGGMDVDGPIPVVWKTPIPTPAEVAWGPVSEMPAEEGLYFPYIQDLADYDHLTVPNLFKRYFMGVFGSTPMMALESFRSFRRDWGVISKTLFGMQMVHIASCVDICLSAQARAFPIFNSGILDGVALLGSGYRVDFAGKLYAPVSSKLLRDAIAESGGHRSVLQAIYGKVGWSIAETEAGTDPLSIFVTMRGLSQALMKKAIAEVDKKTIETMAKGLQFQETYYGINTDDICTALSTIDDCEAVADIKNDVPLHPSYLFETDVLASVWSSFGAMAPNFKPSGGLSLSLSAVEYEAYDFQKKAKAKRAWDAFAVRTTPTEEAIRKLQEVKEDGKVLNLVTGRRSGEHADRMIRGKDWARMKAELVKFAGVESKGVVVSRAGPSIVEVQTMIRDDNW